MPLEESMKKKLLPGPSTVDAPAPHPERERKAFSKEFKLAAVERMRHGEKNPTELALELGIRRNQLYKWAKALDESGEAASFKGPGRLPADQESEITRLRRELARANEELAILKKFDAYLTSRKP
jgi:transposase